MKTELLESLYVKYGIRQLSFGAIHDKLGDVYEEYCCAILSNPDSLSELKRAANTSFDIDVVKAILDCNGLSDYSSIQNIKATTTIPHRASGGLSKTDLIAYVTMIDGSMRVLRISCKQSTVPKVALAEFDVDTICEEVGITDPRLKELLLKHQVDCSAKNFTPTEKEDLMRLMAPIARDFVRWVLTGSPDKNSADICVPTSIVKFKLLPPKNRNNINIDNGDFRLVSFHACDMESYIDSIMYTPTGQIRKGGFGTGLSWTYATGSKGKKMQFKG